MNLKSIKFRMTLTLVLACSMTGFAQFSGSGTQGDPYKIQTAADLAQLATYVNDSILPYADSGKHYLLVNDLDLSAYGASFNNGKGWIPIGITYTIPFKGVFDGNSKKVTGLYINDTLNYVGLFGCIDNGSIVKDMAVEDVTVHGNNRVGGVAGQISKGSIANCYSTGDVSGYSQVGGVAGFIYIDCKVSDCYATGNVSGTNDYVGGVVGYVYTNGEVSNCHSTGAVNGKNYVGGVAGYIQTNGKVSNCYSTGDVSGNGVVGGVAGYVHTNATVSNCHSTGDISGNTEVGGVVGYIYTDGKVSNCHSTGDVSGNGNSVGGVAGYVGRGNVSDCHSIGNVSGNERIGGVAGGISGSASNCYSTGDVSGNGNVGGVAGQVSNRGFVVSNCYSTGNVSGTNNQVGGVVGLIDTDGNISDCYSTGEVNGNSSIGGVAGNISLGYVLDCYSTGKVSGTNLYIGGVAGQVYQGSISNCYSIGEVSGDDRVGGVAGYVTYSSGGMIGKIQNSAALNPSVKGTGSYVGRVTGGRATNTVLSDNIAWDGILNHAGTSNWSDIGVDDLGGANISKGTINTDGTLGGRFAAPTWTTRNGYLPGLLGNTVTMPEHLRIEGMVYILTESLPDGKVGELYSATLTADGDTPITWSMQNGKLPDGLSLDATSGTISGTPTKDGVFDFEVKATNSVGDNTAALSITIAKGVGIEQLVVTSYKLQVYPNPTNGQLTIVMNNEQLTINN